MGGAALSAPAVAADQDQPTVPGTTGAPIPSEPLQVSDDPVRDLGKLSASDALAVARRVTSGSALPRDPSATLALRDLWLKRTQLRGTERRQADGLLARPSDGVADQYGFGYTAPEAAPLCNARLCLHYVNTGTDAPPSAEWPAHNLAVMDSVWTAIVDQLGYRAPLTDGAKGGSPQFDVYLKDLGGDLYGLCAPEKRVKKRTGSGFCVLDNDFATAQFPNATPDDNLVVTAGHEFFHAVQFAYDYAEDPWMMESTATWMEERIATTVNDNRQYLSLSQIYRPYLPLDFFSRTGGYQYGNWVFWEYLSTKYGTDIVKKAWDQAGSLKKDGGKYSITALQKVLKSKGGLTKVYSTYAAGNLTPAANFPEGAEYVFPKVRGGKELSKRKRSKRFGVKIDHLASASYVYLPGNGLDGRKWKLSLGVTGPVKRTSPAAVVVVHMGDGSRQTKRVKLNKRGDGRIKVSFDNRSVSAVSVTLVNGSTRYKCGGSSAVACGGRPLDDNARFAVKGRVVKG
ncbi:hypothetical protein CXG46_15150 [Nocardioides alpinus]|nr:hypothetical protein CXG46_15150 [Nocardioides alpinus]